MVRNQPAIVTAAQQGIAAGLVDGFSPSGSRTSSHGRSSSRRPRRSHRAMVVGVAEKGEGRPILPMELQPAANTLDGLPRTAASQDLRDERWLVARAKLGDEGAFGELYERHRARALRTALGILRNQQDAEDAVQRAFQRVLVYVQRFREDAAFSTWLIRIVINESLMLLRERRTRHPLDEKGMDTEHGDGVLEIADGGPTPEEMLCENERRAALRHAIAGLREKLRVVVDHKELQGLTSTETARRLGLKLSTVKARIFHARRFLRKHLERNFRRVGVPSKLQKRGRSRWKRNGN
jgi:RNA polymerase sigma-70 factor, ECF subfamily